MTPDRTASAAPARPGRYTLPAIALHWLMALLIIGAAVVGILVDDMPNSPSKLKLINQHKWAGITILALAVLRLLWRLGHKPPPDVPMPDWQRKVAHGLHHALYLLFFAVPLMGWAYSSAAGYPVVWFGVLPLPDLVAPDKALASQLKELHGLLAWSLIVLVVLHVAAALKHQFIDRDNLLARMR